MSATRTFVGLAVVALVGCGGVAPASGPAAVAIEKAAVVDVGPAPTASVAAIASAEPDLAPEDQKQFGIIGLLNSSGDPDVTGVFGEIEGSAGSMWGDPIDDSFGPGGIGITGTGVGAGGMGTGTVGLGTIGTLGHGAGSGQGLGSGRLGGSAGPRVATSTLPEVTGSLPPEIIRRIVRQNLTKIRLCYEKQLQKNPALAGKLSMSFVIGKSGAVTSASVASSDVADAEVGKCVASVLQKMIFPAPKGGNVRVSYPFIFSPGDGSAAAPSAPKPAALHGAVLASATSADLEAALADHGWKIVSRGRRNAGAGSIVDLVAEKDGVRANLTFQPAKHVDAAVGVDEANRIEAGGAVRTSGDLFLGVVIAGQTSAAEVLLQSLVGG